MAFPDDDCVYPVGRAEAGRASGSRRSRPRRRDGQGRGRAGRPRPRGSRTRRSSPTTTLEPRNLVRRSSSVAHSWNASGPFDERLGLGSPEPWASGEEIDYLIRAFGPGRGSRTTPHSWYGTTCREDDPRIGARDGASVGYLLRKHDYPARVVARMLVRPLGGALVSLVRSRRDQRPDIRLRRSAVAFAATAGRAERRARRDGRARARARSSRPRSPRGVGVGWRSAQHSSTASASASGSGGSSRSKPSGCGTPIPASSPTSSGNTAAAGIDDGKPQAIASSTRLGHGSFTFVWSRRCARRKSAGASACE